jgi:hypothetical protein
MKQNSIAKTRCVLAGMAAFLLTFGLVLAGCPTDGGSGSVSALENELRNLGDTTADNPVTVVLQAITILKSDIERRGRTCIKTKPAVIVPYYRKFMRSSALFLFGTQEHL